MLQEYADLSPVDPVNYLERKCRRRKPATATSSQLSIRSDQKRRPTPVITWLREKLPS